MEADGGARASPAAAVCSGRRGQRKGASRAAVSGGGAVALDGDRKGAEELVGWQPWSSARDGNGDRGRVRARGSQAKPRTRQRGRAEKWRCSGIYHRGRWGRGARGGEGWTHVGRGGVR
jgi:hypothetical protein